MLLSLATCLTCTVTSAVAQNGYSIKEVARADSNTSLSIVRSNSTGWIITSKVGASVSKEINELLGPGGYRRDISSFTDLPVMSYQPSTYPLAVGEDGAVYYERLEYSTTNEGKRESPFLSERKLLKLGRDASTVNEIFSVKRGPATEDGILVNAKGQMLYYSSDLESSAPIAITRMNGKRESLQNFTLPALPKGKEQSFTFLLDDTGKFILSRVAYSTEKSTWNDLCSGSLDNETITCLDKVRFRLYEQKGYYISQLVNGILLLSGSNVHESLDAITFTKKSSFRVSSRKTSLSAILDSNGSVVTFLAGRFLEYHDAKLLVFNPASGKSQLACDVIQQMKLSPGALVYLSEGADGAILMTLDDSSRPKKQSQILLLSPAPLSGALPADAIGTCKPVN
jgi:hypothetical protein